MLLLLDNLEQVIDAAPELAQLLERRARTSSCSSRPRASPRSGRGRVRGSPACRVRGCLALLRALAARAERAIAELCRRLDNLPLGVELAAARTKRALARADPRAPLTAARSAQGWPRCRSPPADAASDDRVVVRAALPEEQELFSRLRVFAGGCILEAAEEVAMPTSTRCSRWSRRASYGSPTGVTGCSRRFGSTPQRRSWHRMGKRSRCNVTSSSS